MPRANCNVLPRTSRYNATSSADRVNGPKQLDKHNANKKYANAKTKFANAIEFVVDARNVSVKFCPKSAFHDELREAKNTATASHAPEPISQLVLTATPVDWAMAE